MSLVKDNDLIIPNTVGIVSAAVKEANRHLDRYREHNSDADSRYRNMAEYIREMPKIQSILQSRVNGIALEQLVDPARISNDRTRAMTKEEVILEREMKQQRSQRAYEDWFKS